MQGRTTTSQYKHKAGGNTVFFFLNNVPASKTWMQGRTTTSRYKCKTDKKIVFCFCWNLPATKECKIEQLHLHTKARPVGGLQTQIPKHPKQKYKVAHLHLDTNSTPIVDLFCLKCPGNQNKNARPNNFIPIQKQDRCADVFWFVELQRHSKRACKLEQAHSNTNPRPKGQQFLSPPATKTSMQGRTITAHYKCQTDRETIFLILKCPCIQNKNARSNNYILIQMQDRQEAFKTCHGNQDKHARSNNYIPIQM